MPVEVRRFAPQPKQREFLSNPADIVVGGGSAGGGKSFALLYEALRHVKVPGFTSIIFRRSYPEITNAGGLWDQASDLYVPAGGRPIRGELEFRWKSGARVSFRHLEHHDDVHQYQGSQICYLAFDELTHFTEHQFFYMLSRNRSTCGIRPYVRATCNPDPNWVKTTLLTPWVDDEYPGERAQSGDVLQFRRINGKVTWVPPGTDKAKSIAFVRMSVYDNPALLEVNPEYLNNLEALPPVERERLLLGNWTVRREGLVYPDHEQVLVNAPLKLSVAPTSGGMDFGFRNPFAAVWGHVDCDDCLWITGCRYKSGVTLPVHAEHLPGDVYWWADPAEPESIRELRIAGHRVRPCVHVPTRGAGGEKRNPKMSGIESVSGRMRTGRLKIVRCEATKPLIRELGLYRYDPAKTLEEPIDQDNHACDALRYLVVGLDRGRRLEPMPSETLEQRQERDQARAEAVRLEREEMFRIAAENPLDERLWS